MPTTNRTRRSRGMLAEISPTTLARVSDNLYPADPAEFDEPAGLTAAAGRIYVADTNNHLIRVVELDQGNRVRTLKIDGLSPPQEANE